MTWDGWLAATASQRESAGLTRNLHARSADDRTVDLAGNDYLGLARDQTVRQAAADAAMTFGGGAGASRLVTGTLDLHVELEQELADYLGQPAALVFSSGYAANLAAVTALVDRSCHVISDAHIHASLIDAARLSRAEVTVVPHNDIAAVRAALGTSTGQRRLVLAESVYSVLGDAAPLTELAALCARHDALLVVDEAHGLGVHGPGLVARAGLAGHPNVIVTATLSKSLGSQGGAVLSSEALRDHLINTARSFIFDTALAPAPTAAALAALRILRHGNDLPNRVGARVKSLAAALGVPVPAGAVLSIPMPSPQAAVAAQAAALAEGIRVGCFRPPSVPDGISRLRATASAGIAEEDWQRATEVLVAVSKEYA